MKNRPQVLREVTKQHVREARVTGLAITKGEKDEKCARIVICLPSGLLDPLSRVDLQFDHEHAARHLHHDVGAAASADYLGSDTRAVQFPPWTGDRRRLPQPLQQRVQNGRAEAVSAARIQKPGDEALVVHFEVRATDHLQRGDGTRQPPASLLQLIQFGGKFCPEWLRLAQESGITH